LCCWPPLWTTAYTTANLRALRAEALPYHPQHGTSGHGAARTVVDDELTHYRATEMPMER
jgi:hypothetical protein